MQRDVGLHDAAEDVRHLIVRDVSDVGRQRRVLLPADPREVIGAEALDEAEVLSPPCQVRHVRGVGIVRCDVVRIDVLRRSSGGDRPQDGYRCDPNDCRKQSLRNRQAMSPVWLVTPRPPRRGGRSYSLPSGSGSPSVPPEISKMVVTDPARRTPFPSSLPDRSENRTTRPYGGGLHSESLVGANFRRFRRVSVPTTCHLWID